ncbi:MAG TPA: glycosyltransferase family 2 protein [Patescibacteria group bacterium]|nr:glycosyltransferase family 2 protein [Patescibacteria group bacterium]
MHALSVIIPCYNEGSWLPETIARVERAIQKAKLKSYQIVVVNDGSTDDTEAIIKDLQRKNKHIDLVSYPKNKGRFLARKAGIERTKHEFVLFLDSRVYADENSLAYVTKQMAKNPKLVAWNGHVRIKLGWNIFARFWDAVTHLAWRRYYQNPKLTQFGIDEFDYYPKGTGFLLGPRAVFMRYIEEFKPQNANYQFVSDDTALLRNLTREVKLTIAPEFSCLYHSRDRFSAFTRHTFKRGTFFADGFFKPGNRFFIPLIGFLIATPLALAVLAVRPILALIAFAVFWLLELLAVLLRGVPAASALSLWLLTPVFAVLYGAGIWRGVLMIMWQRLQRVAARYPRGMAYSAAFVLYAACTLYYMGGAATHCTQSLLSFPGDNTAGMIAYYSADSHSPWLGQSIDFSYPYGESLWQPTQITAQAIFIPFWLIAKVVGPVCSFNVLSMIGFMSAALAMFAFVRWLLGGRTLVALLAGFAVAFTPYLQNKTGVHISYVFEAVFIAAAWLFLWFWREPSLKKALLLALPVALFAYIDGYFILLGGVLVAALLAAMVLSTLARDGWRLKSGLVRRFKLLLLTFGAAVVCVAPVLYVDLHASSQISGLLAATRDSIYQEAEVYGARPLEYLVPNALNPLTNHVFGAYAKRDNHGSNPAENILSLSITLMALAAFLVVRSFVGLRRKKPLVLERARLQPRAIAWIFGVVFVAAVLMSFPPRLGSLVMPSDVLIRAVQLWRVFARLSVIVNIALVVLASYGLALLLERIKVRWHRVAVAVLVFALVFTEYLTFVPPRPVAGYNQVPELYTWLSTQQAYQDMAEYPLDEPGTSAYSVYYNTYQRVDGKHLLNGIVSNPQPLFARHAVLNLASPQAVPGLRTLGIDFVVVHAVKNPGPIAGLQLMHSSPEPVLQDTAWGYRVLPGPMSGYVAAPAAGFHAPIKNSVIMQTQEVGHDGVLQVKRLLHTSPVEQSVTLGITAKALVPAGQLVSIRQGNTVVWQGVIPATYQSIEFAVDPSQDVHIMPIKPTTDATLWLSQITVE